MIRAAVGLVPSRARALSRGRILALAALVSFLPFSAHATAAEPSEDELKPPAFAASTTAAAHRIRLPDGVSLELKLSNFEGTLELRTRSGAPLRAQLPLYSTPCRQVDPDSDDVRLTCKTGRIDAQLVTAGGHHYLDLRELRGLPTNPGDEGPPEVLYPPEDFAFGAPCPGDSDAGRGECFYEQGQDAKAEKAFTAALGHDLEKHFAAVRLGDLAVRHRDPNAALGWYLKAGDLGVWSRLATERLCELTGSCFDDSFMSSFDSAGLAPIVRTELMLREIRLLILLGRWDSAMEHLANLLDDTPSACAADETKLLCRKMVLAALRARACPREASMSSYLRLPMYLSGPLAPELARAAAQDAQELGAPAYGATLLSATARLATPADLLMHAKQAIALYRAADDPYRAHVMWSWVSTRLTPKQQTELPPDTLIASVPGRSALDAASADLDTDESAAMLAITKSMLARSKLAAPPTRSGASKKRQ